MPAKHCKTIHDWLTRGPCVGDLQSLCEENYRHLLGLVPQLPRLQGQHLSQRPGHTDLLLTVVEQTPYTTLIRLTYHFSGDDRAGFEPDALLRVYHDARQVEVEDLRQQNLPTTRLYEAPALLNKWRLNLFVKKWLSFCRQQGHLFVADVTPMRPVACQG